MYKEASLITINQGAAVELFEEEFKKVLANINDISTEAEDVREITLKFRIEPSKDRQSAITTVKATSKLPGARPHGSAIHLSFGKDNKAKAFVHNMSQGSLFETAKGPVPVQEKKEDEASEE